MTINAQTKIYGLVGQNIGYSLSPALQNAAILACGLNAVYLAFSVFPEHSPNILTALETLQLSGVNITQPYKTLLFQQLKEIDATAQLMEAVNTLKKTNQGWVGYNTDGIGFLRGLSQLNLSLKEQTFHLIGAGGAAKAIAFALAGEGVELTFSNRNKAHLAHLLGLLQKNFPGTPFNASEPRPGSVLVNTTTVGTDFFSLSAPKIWVERCSAVVDIIYSPLETPLLKLAKELSKPCQNGLAMLLGQAEKAFEIWFEQPAPPAMAQVISEMQPNEPQAVSHKV